jgi:hypothetical protein
MAERTTYYAIVDDESDIDRPAGIVRRREDPGGFADEGLHADLAWHRTPVIAEWERGESTDNLEEITAEQAERVIDQLRGRWSKL